MSNEQGRVRRIPTILLSVAVVVAVVVAMMIVGGAASPAVAFQQTGHWVFNRSESSVVHVDSGTRQVDARVLVPGAGADPVFALQGDRQGFLVGRKSITVFGKSTLTVDTTIPTGQAEMPIGIEVVGGPYLVYRQAGTIVRLGVPPLTVQIGGPVGRPVSTDDGTVWLHRPDTGALCALRRGADTLDCTLQTAPGASGALTVVSGAPAFLDTTRDATQIIEAAALAAAVPIGTDLPDTALIADRDTQGRLPALVTGPNRLVLADSSGVPTGRAGSAPIPIDLGEGQFTSPVAADGVVAVIEQTRNRLLTFGIDGRPLGVVDLPPGEGAASIGRGEDGRIYVDDADGAVTHVVGADGKVTSIKTGGVVSAIVAAPPDQSSLIPPPPRRDPRPPTTGLSQPVQNQPGPLPVKQPDPPTEKPPTPVEVIPAAPTGVTAVAKPDGSVAVAWNAVAGRAVQYSVNVDGAGVTRVGGASATLPGLTAGQTYTITVAATNAAGEGPESTGVSVTPFSGPNAPGGLTAVRHNLSGSTIITLDWAAPALGGGALVGYEVRGSGTISGAFTSTVTTTTYQDNKNYCSPTVTYAVRAITTPPGGGTQTKGPAATATLTTPVDCTPPMLLDSATASSSTSVTVVLHCPGSGRGGATKANVTLSFNGTRRWSGTCQVADLIPMPSTTATVPGLDPATTYTVTGTVSTPSGSKPAQNSLSVTTPAG